MDKFEKEDLNKREKFKKYSWFDWLINYVHNSIKKLQAVLKIMF